MILSKLKNSFKKVIDEGKHAARQSVLVFSVYR